MLNAGNSLAMLALITGLGLVFYPVLSGLRRIPASLLLITHGVSLQAAFLILVYALITDDFSVSYVMSHSETSLPLLYKVSAAWGGHGGSLLFWVMLQVGWMGLFYWFCRPFSKAQKNIALSFMAMISTGLIGLLLVSSPFASVVLYALWSPASVVVKLSCRSLVLLSVVMLLLVACGSILLGTLYPIGFEAFGSGQISVGAPYFNAFFIPLALMLAAILTGFSVHIRQVSVIAIAGEATLFVLAGLVLSWLIVGIGGMT
ncbi:MAG: hypothetical protein B0D91_11040 [Oceanospirillales bacterium LUC14_002_19_P2]|nr:MAG: hypothetical protein B0D91_11040 [Oceanospirillales bacterium LUC14_002_19_P2]